MSDFQKVSFDISKLAPLFKEKGVDIDDPNLQAEVEAHRNSQHQGWVKEVNSREKDRYWRFSLFSGGHESLFSFPQWNPALQPNEQQARHLGEQAWRLAKKMVDQPLNVAMFGNPGVGKTALSLAIADYLEDHGQRAMFVSSSALTSLYDDRFENYQHQQKIFDTLNFMEKADVLILDDFGTEGGQRDQFGKLKPIRRDFQKDLLEVCDARYGGNNQVLKSTIVTTNNNTKDLKQLYMPKIISRLIPGNLEQQLMFTDMQDVRMKG